jgi:hypothetical protein
MVMNYMEKFSRDTFTPMKITQVITDGCDCYPWHEVYAWFPVETITGKTIWMEKVFKRKIWLVWGTGFHMEPGVEYATMFELIADNEDRYNA